MDKECKDVFYLYLHQRISSNAFKNNKNGIMSVAESEWQMFQWKIPEIMRPVIIKIWENLKIIKKVDRRTIQFIKTDFDVNKLGKVYSDLGLF